MEGLIKLFYPAIYLNNCFSPLRSQLNFALSLFCADSAFRISSKYSRSASCCFLFMELLWMIDNIFLFRWKTGTLFKFEYFKIMQIRVKIFLFGYVLSPLFTTDTGKIHKTILKIEWWDFRLTFLIPFSKTLLNFIRVNKFWYYLTSWINLIYIWFQQSEAKQVSTI